MALPDTEFVRSRLSARMPWIPTRDGERACLCCGIHWFGVVLDCGCAYCGICEGRGHDEDHGKPGGDECTQGAESPVFRRADHDCPVCETRHDDWERCADALAEAIAALRAARAPETEAR